MWFGGLACLCITDSLSHTKYVQTNDVLCSPRMHTNEYYICVCPLCVLEKRGVSECYTILPEILSVLFEGDFQLFF